MQTQADSYAKTKTKTSINSTPLDYIFIKNKHFKINLHIYLTGGKL